MEGYKPGTQMLIIISNGGVVKVGEVHEAGDFVQQAGEPFYDVLLDKPCATIDLTLQELPIRIVSRVPAIGLGAEGERLQEPGKGKVEALDFLGTDPDSPLCRESGFLIVLDEQLDMDLVGHRVGVVIQPSIPVGSGRPLDIYPSRI